MSFLYEVERSGVRLEEAYVDWRGRVWAPAFLEVAHRLAAVDTGAMKAGVHTFEGSPDPTFNRPENADAFDRRPGAPPSPAIIARALADSRRAGAKGRFGLQSQATYSVYVDEGTEYMAAQPFWNAAVSAAQSITYREQVEL